MTIKKQAYALTLLPPSPTPGEAVFYGNGVTNTFSFIVPDYVYAISAVVIGQGKLGGGQLVSKISRGGTDLLTSIDALGGGVGGGNGGSGAYGIGGAGGYTGNGGNGDAAVGGNGTAGNGGGGGGGATNGYGGPVGLLGQGANGAGGVYGGVIDGGTGSPPATGYPAGGQSKQFGTAGGNLRWRNNIAVTPGETLTVTLSSISAPSSIGVNGGARLLWGNDGRSYPSNAADAVPKGQALIALSNTTFTVPAGVTSLCACAQQQTGASAAVSLVVGGVTVLRAQNGARIGDGGGDGGAGADGGGGGGGYSGNGGAGGISINNGDGTYNGQPGSAGTGGGGAGGGGSSVWKVTDPVWGGSGGAGWHLESSAPQPGGGVGISGQGASGTASGDPGSPDPINGYMGGGSGGQAGGALAWKNAIAVTPGQVLTVNAAGGRVRLIWGPGRSYPSAAGNV